MSGSERLRFSPAPTGELHLGGARTALFDHLIARSTRGALVLRFEDTDVVRSDAAHEAALIRDLSWLGIEWQEGPDVGGPVGPYRQSERAAFYARAIERLVADGAVYRCFCDEPALAAQRSADSIAGRAPRYHGTCRALSLEESDRRASEGEPYCWRFKVDQGQEIVVHDAVHGDVVFSGASIGDFLVSRSDGGVLYDMACAVDDAEMGITFVVRGDDHLSNTPRQLLLLQALGHPAPRYAHVPLVLGRDGRPLSKSRGAESIASLRDAGYLPGAVLNHLALLGWSDPAGREVMRAEDIVGAFEIDRVSPSSPSHDPDRLRWLNGRHMALLDPGERAAVIEPHIPALPGVRPGEAALMLAGEVEVAGDVSSLLAGVVTALAPDDEARAALASPVAAIAIAEAAATLRREGDPDKVRDSLRAAALPMKEAFPAVRAALTGRAHGLPVATLIRLMGIQDATRRLESAAGA